ncbi:MAG TPA: response regulator [Flavobacteriales bacterium]
MHSPLSIVPPTLPCVLYIDDDAANRQVFSAAFRREFKVLTAQGLAEAWSLLDTNNVHVVISDQRMPGITGSEALRMIRERYPRTRRMLVTAYADLEAVVDALNQGGVCYYIHKPWEPEEVRRVVLSAFAEIQLEDDRNAYTEKLLEANRQLEFALRQRLLS